MPVELRKRKARDPPPAPAPKKTSKVTKAVQKAKETVKGKSAKPVDKKDEPAQETAKGKPVKVNEANGSGSKPTPGVVLTLDGFGGEIETNDGIKTTLKELVDKSKTGVVLFTYPKASTPGCTTQACLFRDSYEPLTETGFAIYGLSADSPKANTSFRDKHELPYPLLCDPAATLIAAIGLNKSPKGTQRGVFVIAKDGKVLAAEPGGPAATVGVVRKLVEDAGQAAGEDDEDDKTDEVSADGDGAAAVEKKDVDEEKPVEGAAAAEGA